VSHRAVRWWHAKAPSCT